MGVFMVLKPGETEWEQSRAHFHECKYCGALQAFDGDKCDKKHNLNCKRCKKRKWS